MKVAFHRFEPYRINDMAGGAAGFIISMPGGVFVSRNGSTGKSALTPIPKQKALYVEFLHETATKISGEEVLVFYGERKPSEKNILELIASADSDAHQQALNV